MKVLVLLSAYNGEKFLKEQIDSVLAQKDVGVSLLVRDDGSTDKTEDILKSYGSKISYYKDNNIGVKASFFDLISRACPSDFYAFCDQDDFWLPDKLSCACNMLKKTDKPALYFSNLLNADENLKVISKTDIKTRLTFGAAMAENPATGCTMVFNRAFFDIIKKTPAPDKISMHDTWVYRAALMTGAEVFFDKTPHILYRQHSSNLIGSRGLSARLRHYADFFLKNKSFSRPYEVRLLLDAFGEITPPENIKLSEDILNYKTSFKSKLSLILGGKIKTSRLSTNIVAAAAVLLGKF